MGSSSQGGGCLSRHARRQGQDVERRQSAEAVLPTREDDHRLCVLEHVGDQGFRQVVSRNITVPPALRMPR